MLTGVRSRPVGHRWPGGFAFSVSQAASLARRTVGGPSGESDCEVGSFHNIQTLYMADILKFRAMTRMART